MSEATIMAEWEQFPNPSLHLTLRETRVLGKPGVAIAQKLPGMWDWGTPALDSAVRPEEVGKFRTNSFPGLRASLCREEGQRGRGASTLPSLCLLLLPPPALTGPSWPLSPLSPYFLPSSKSSSPVSYIRRYLRQTRPLAQSPAIV